MRYLTLGEVVEPHRAIIDATKHEEPTRRRVLRDQPLGTHPQTAGLDHLALVGRAASCSGIPIFSMTDPVAPGAAVVLGYAPG